MPRANWISIPVPRENMDVNITSSQAMVRLMPEIYVRNWKVVEPIDSNLLDHTFLLATTVDCRIDTGPV